MWPNSVLPIGWGQKCHQHRDGISNPHPWTHVWSQFHAEFNPVHGWELLCISGGTNTKIHAIYQWHDKSHSYHVLFCLYIFEVLWQNGRWIFRFWFSSPFLVPNLYICCLCFRGGKQYHKLLLSPTIFAWIIYHTGIFVAQTASPWANAAIGHSECLCVL